MGVFRKIPVLPHLPKKKTIFLWGGTKRPKRQRWMVASDIFWMLVHLVFFIYTMTRLSPKVAASFFAEGSHRTEISKRKIHSHSHSLITPTQTLLGTPGEVQPDRVSIQPFGHHKAGHTQDPRQDSTASSGVPPKVPDPPSYRVESVTLPTLYQSYNPISHTPPCIPIHAHPPNFL